MSGNTPHAWSLAKPERATAEQQIHAILDAVKAQGDLMQQQTAAISQRLDKLTQAVLVLTQQQGGRLSRAEVCQRLNIHRTTLLRRLKTDRHFPRPGPDGKWSVSELLRWELANTAEGRP